MEFARALDEILVEAGWEVVATHTRDDMLLRGVQSRNNSRLKTVVAASIPDIQRTWDKWAEAKQSRGREKLRANVPSASGFYPPGSNTKLFANHWDPDAS